MNKEKPEPCRECSGSGIQQNLENLKVLCPICNGSGLWADRFSDRPGEKKKLSMVEGLALIFKNGYNPKLTEAEREVFRRAQRAERFRKEWLIK